MKLIIDSNHSKIILLYNIYDNISPFAPLFYCGKYKILTFSFNLFIHKISNSYIYGQIFNTNYTNNNLSFDNRKIILLLSFTFKNNNYHFLIIYYYLYYFLN